MCVYHSSLYGSHYKWKWRFYWAGRAILFYLALERKKGEEQNSVAAMWINVIHLEKMGLCVIRNIFCAEMNISFFIEIMQNNFSENNIE